MYKISILKDQVTTNEAIFETLDLANNWLEKGQSLEWWGKSEQQELDSEGVPTGNVIPAEYEVIIQDISTEIEQEKTNAECLKYLQETDYYIVRFMETGKEVPQEVLDKRAEARLKIVK